MMLADLRPLSMDLFSVRDWGYVDSHNEFITDLQATTFDAESAHAIPNLHELVVDIESVYASASNVNGIGNF